MSIEHYGSWKTIYSRFCLWHDTSLLEFLFIALNWEANYKNLSINSTVVTAHQQNAVAKNGGWILLIRSTKVRAMAMARAQQKFMSLLIASENSYFNYFY